MLLMSVRLGMIRVNPSSRVARTISALWPRAARRSRGTSLGNAATKRSLGSAPLRSGRRESSFLLALLDHLDEAVEEIVAVGRSRRGFRMVLHREGRLVGAAQALVGAVEQRDVGHLDVLGQRLGNDAEAVVLRRDLDLAGGQVLDRLVGAAMAALHLPGLAAQRQRQELVTEADAEDRHLLVEH